MSPRRKYSHVYTFRLSEDDPDEGRALEILEKHQQKHGTRHIMTRALLALGHNDLPKERRGSGAGVDMRALGSLFDARFEGMTGVIEKLVNIVDDLANAEQRGYSRADIDKLNDQARGLSDDFRRVISASVDLGDDE